MSADIIQFPEVKKDERGLPEILSTQIAFVYAQNAVVGLLNSAQILADIGEIDESKEILNHAADICRVLLTLKV